MDSLVFLCARRVVAQCPLPDIPAHLYPVVFQAALLDRRRPILQGLVATWPFKELHVQQLLRPLGLHWNYRSIACCQAIIQGVVTQLQRELEEPGSDSRCQLRLVDMTGFWEDPDNGITEDLAEACVELSKHQQELQRRRRKRRKGCSGATTATPQLPGVDVHIDLFVNETSYEIVRDALQTGATAPLRIKCHKFEAKFISASQIVTLLQCLDPSCLRRVKHGRGMLPSLRTLNMEDSLVSGNLRQILGDLQTPLESLELPFCSLVPDDLTFLSQSFHAPALKRLDLSSNEIFEGLLEPLRLLLEKASASLLYLDLSDCHIADSHLAVLLPTLLRCSRLRVLGLYRNPLSMAAIQDLLQKTLELPNLHLVMYPIPLDCHTRDPSEFDSDCFDESLDQQLLSAAKAEISQLLQNSGRTNLVWTDDLWSLKDLDYFSL